MKTISLLFIISSFINCAVTESVMVNMGFSLTLHTNIIIQSNDVIEWRFGFKNKLIAKLDRGSISLFNGSAGTFSDRLKINNHTGDLTVIEVTVQLIGLYHLQIPGEKSTRKTFNIGCQSGFGGEVTSLAVMEGHSVRLSIGAPDRENYDVIRWKFQESPLLELNRKTKITSTHDDVHDERFRDRLKLDNWSRDITISNITTDLSGLYEVNIDSNSGTHTMHQSYTVTVQCEVKSVSVMEGDYVTLQADDQMQNDDLIEWWFGHQETLLGRLDNVGRADRLYDGVWDVRFSDRLGLSVRDGSFIFRNITTAHAGLYEVTISSKRRSIQRTFIVSVSARDVSSGVRAQQQEYHHL
ncbi:uncharacterized protein LOC130548657 [Triplophysa rosa]|uniref:uncharacterized protein LOC130548657 n=1 Tax=Triplophysa rosa TaxID=992332 RepID=UPI0025463043|nr:uncharacterized protein LOC130548657 [Triplophysa rosa]